MNDKTKVLQKLEIFSYITLWISGIGGGILLITGFNACSSVNEAVSGLERYVDISGTITSLFGFFMIIDIILMVSGITLSYIARAVALHIKGGLLRKEDVLFSSQLMEQKQMDSLTDMHEHDPLHF